MRIEAEVRLFPVASMAVQALVSKQGTNLLAEQAQSLGGRGCGLGESRRRPDPEESPNHDQPQRQLAESEEAGSDLVASEERANRHVNPDLRGEAGKTGGRQY
jgi:hypothetical protein